MDNFKVALKVKAKHGKLQEFIERMGWTESDLARKLGATPSTVGKWFNMSSFPGKKFRSAICELLKETEEVLFPEALNNPRFLKNRKAVTMYKELDMIVLSVGELNALPASVDKEQEYMVDKEDMRKEISTVLNMLTPREKTVLSLYFGLDGQDEKNMVEIANELNLSIGRINQIKLKALHKMRRPKMACRLKDWI